MTRELVSYLSSRGVREPNAIAGRLSYASFVPDAENYLYIETPKAACSTMKHIVAALENKSVPQKHVGHESSLAMCVHNRQVNPVKSLSALSQDVIAHLLEDDSVIRFCVVRNPYARLASAWADKIRQREPGYENTWKFINRFCGRKDLLTSPSFTDFVRWLVKNQDPARCNLHWRPMHRLLIPDVINYTHIIKTEALETGLQDIFQTIAPGQRAGEYLSLFKTNESLPLSWQKLYDARLASQVYQFYEQDFRLFDYAAGSWISEPENRSQSETITHLENRLAVLENAALEAVRKRNETINYLLKKSGATAKEKVRKKSVVVLSQKEEKELNQPDFLAMTPGIVWRSFSSEPRQLAKDSSKGHGLFSDTLGLQDAIAGYDLLIYLVQEESGDEPSVTELSNVAHLSSTPLANRPFDSRSLNSVTALSTQGYGVQKRLLLDTRRSASGNAELAAWCTHKGWKYLHLPKHDKVRPESDAFRNGLSNTLIPLVRRLVW